jgi:oligopeptide/dipeptide ABC transporter ATP-binding protein
MTYLVISHDLSVIRHLCQRVIVMYLGRAIEVAPTEALIHRPRHPYTQALMSAIPIPDPDYERPRIRLKGDIYDSSGARDRCPLAVRCHKAVEACHHTPQHLVQIEENRWTACHRVSGGEI